MLLTHSLRRVLVLICLALVAVTGCKDKEDDTPAPTPTVYPENANPAVNTPLNEVVAAQSSTWTKCVKLGDKTFDFAAMYDSTSSTFHIRNLDGSQVTEQLLSFEVRLAIATTYNGTDAVLAVGGSGLVRTSYKYFTQANVSLFDATGRLVSGLSLTEPGYSVSFRDITPDAHNNTNGYYWAGGVAIDNSQIQYPYVVKLAVVGGALTKVESLVLTQYPRARVMGITHQEVTQAPNPAQEDLILATNSYPGTNPYADSRIVLIKPNYFAYPAGTGWGATTWSRSITGNIGQGYTSPGCLLTTSTGVLVAGYTDDVKTPPTADGTNWTSGIAASVDLTGNVLWRQVFSASTKSDGFYAARVFNGYCYFSGFHSLSYHDSKHLAFSNGLLAKCDLMTGNLISYKTFGDKYKGSYLTDISLDTASQSVYCAGYTNAKFWLFRTEQ